MSRFSSDRIFICVAALVVSVVVFIPRSRAEDATAEPQQHQVGSYALEVRGVPAKLYLQTAYEYGDQLNPEVVRAVRRGDTEWISEKKGEGLTYQVIVPKSYQPGRLHGLVVFINSNDSGALPKQYQPALEKYNLIAVGADHSGNKRDRNLRHCYAVHAVAVMQERYDIDPDRIYVTGLSGGGRVASQVMIMNADVFSGGFPVVGANPCIAMEDVDSHGNRFRSSGVWKKPDRARLRTAARERRYVMVTGEKDYNRAGCKAIYEGYKQAGFKHIDYLEEPGREHGPVSGEYFEKTIELLDAPLAETAATDYEKAERFATSGRKGLALQLYRKAVAHGRNAEWADEAEEKAADLQTEYEQLIKSIEKAIDDQNRQAYREGVTTVQRDWREMVDRQTIRQWNERFDGK
jgi:hypothetical protein